MWYDASNDSVEAYAAHIQTRENVDTLTLPSVAHYLVNPAFVHRATHVTIHCGNQPLNLTWPGASPLISLVIVQANRLVLEGPLELLTLRLQSCRNLSSESIRIIRTHALELEQCVLGPSPVTWPLRVTQFLSRNSQHILTLDLSYISLIEALHALEPYELHTSSPIMSPPRITIGPRFIPLSLAALLPRRLTVTRNNGYTDLKPFITRHLERIDLVAHPVAWDIPVADIQVIAAHTRFVYLSGRFTPATLWHMIQHAMRRLLPLSIAPPLHLVVPHDILTMNPHPQYVRPLWTPDTVNQGGMVLARPSRAWILTFMLSLRRYLREHGLPANHLAVEIIQQIFEWVFDSPVVI